MKKSYLILLSYVLSCTYASAADKYWVGPVNGNWTNGVNWSFLSGGIGGAGQPTSTDGVIFTGGALVNVNTSTSIYSLRTSFGSNNVTLYSSIGSTLNILNTLRVEPLSSLKDSTSANVAFNVVFNGANHATANIFGDWIFEGGVPVTGNNGSKFTAESGALVTVATSPFFVTGTGGRIIFKKNTSTIASTSSSLKFSYGSYYILDNNLNPSIPAATWAKDSVQAPNVYAGFLGAPASTILITGNMGPLQYAGAIPNFGAMVIDLPNLTADASLALPDGSKIRGNLEILNTNNHTLVLLAATSASSSVQVEVGTSEAGYLFGGYLNVSGNTKVALAKATAAAPATSYKLIVNKTYNQGGGNFSLQDYDGATGSSTLSVKDDLLETNGTFVTNSTSTSSSAKFVVSLDDPNFIVGPSNGFSSLRTISISSGTIDNSQHMVTLRIDHTVYNNPGFESLPNGVILQSPLEVGKLELARSPLTTSAINILTVSNPASNAIFNGTTGNSYVNGPLKRATNATQSYDFPTGKGYSAVTSYHVGTASVVPTSATPSIYRTEYFSNSFPDLSLSSPLKGVLNNGYWDITKISGSDAQVKLTLSSAVGGAMPADGLIVSQYVGGDWVSKEGSVLTPGNVTFGSALSKPLSSFTSFTFGYADPANLTLASSGGLTYKFYQGVYGMLPDFNALTPVTTGNSSNVDINVRPSGTDDGFAFIWQGTITLPSAGSYTFETVSDDGSKLYFNTPYNVNATALVNNDGGHGSQSMTGTVNVPAAGTYPITITYFENTGGESMQVYWSGPGIPRQLIPDAAFKPATQSSNGLSYKFYQGVYTTLPDFSVLTPVKTGSSANVDINVRPSGIDDGYAFVWEGYINIPSAGNYTFETNSDDGSKLYFNSTYNINTNALVNNDGIHAAQSATGSVYIPAAGLYPIAITFFENYGGEGMQVYWSGPGFSRQQIPDAAFTSTAATLPVSGLNFRYYEGDFNLLPDYNSLTPVKTGTSANADISVRTPGVNDHFAFIWDGYINLPSAGTYTFETISDDGSKVYVNTPYAANGASTVNNDGLHAPNAATGTVTAPSAGRYPITITYFEKDGGETMQLYWSGPGISRQLVPDAAFTTTTAATSTVTMSGNPLASLNSTVAEIATTRIYPNPFVESFTIDYYNPRSDKSKVSIGFYDLNGRLIYSYQPATLVTGNNRWIIQPGSGMMAAGIYTAQIKVNGTPVRSVKLLKVKK